MRMEIHIFTQCYNETCMWFKTTVRQKEEAGDTSSRSPSEGTWQCEQSSVTVHIRRKLAIPLNEKVAK